MARIFRYLASSLVIAACAVPLSVFAAGPIVTDINRPKGAWVVGPINAPSSSGVGYCSMKNTYDDGLTLVFARDAEGSNSIAVDFHKKLLKTGGQYNVTLKSGAVQRNMAAIAATPTVLIVQMGLDRDFYAVMAKKDSLALDFGAAEVSFSLKGTSDAMEVLTKCAHALGKGQKFAETKVAAGRAVATPEALAASSIEPAAGGEGGFSGYLGQENASLPAIEPLSNKRADETNIGLQAANDELKRQVAELKVQNRKLLSENQKIAELMMNSDDNGAEMEMTGAQTHDRESALAAENMRLRAALNELPEPQGIPVAQIEPAAGQALGPFFLTALLDAAQIPATADSRNPEVLVWGAEGGVYGSGEQRKLGPKGGLEAAVAGYMNEARGRCPGDFANTSGKLKKINGQQVIESEIACLDGQQDAAAAVLFIAKDGQLAVISHEAAPDRMTAALAGRDAVISAISGQ